MARKDLLRSLMAAPPAEAEKTTEAAPAPAPRYGGGAIGAVGQSIAELRARALIEVLADMIDPAGLRDRLDEDPEGHAALVASIREHGQQVPVLLRHDPNVEGRYQVVYGRRRVAALRELRQPVRALLRDLDDRALIIAQGQENSARKDLSFIEKAHFADNMRAMGFDRAAICAALHVDKTVVSRMLGVAETLGPKLIHAVGAAPAVGRDRWLALADLWRRAKPDMRDQAEARLAGMQGSASDARFEALVAALSPHPQATAKAAALPLEANGMGLGSMERKRGRTTLSFAPEEAAFGDWLARNIARLHAEWQAQDDGTEQG